MSSSWDRRTGFPQVPFPLCRRQSPLPASSPSCPLTGSWATISHMPGRRRRWISARLALSPAGKRKRLPYLELPVPVEDRLLTNRGPDRSGSCLISIWQLPDQSGSCLILPWWLPDQSGSCLILIGQQPDRSGICLILSRKRPDQSGRCLILIRQLPDRSGSRLIFIFSDFVQSNF